MDRKTSPNYPRLTISESLERIKRLYKHQQTHAAPSEVVAQALGYTTVNGASKGVIATLKQYGLLEGAGDRLRVSDQSVSILDLASADPERRRALSAIILSPAVFAELHKGFGNDLPLSAKALLVKKGFTAKAADEVVRIYRSNIEFVNAEPDADISFGDIRTHVPKPEVQATPENFRRPTTELRSDPVSGEQMLHFKIAESTEARIQLRGVVTQEAIKKLVAFLELSVDAFPTSRTVTA